MYCSTRCRVAAHRSRRLLPTELTDRTSWVRADGKRPITVDGRAASCTDRSTWSTLHAVRQSTAGDGFGIMLGDGLGCYDLDHCFVDGELTEQAQAYLDAISEPIIMAERSLSGSGLHVFVLAPEAPGTRRPGFERYTRARFIRMTGEIFSM